MVETIIELDHHTHSRPVQAALESFTAFYRQKDSGWEHLARPVYDLVDAAPDDYFFCASSAAEAVCQVIWSVFCEVSRKEGKTQFITSCIEDAPTLQMLKRCETLGCAIKVAPVDADGRIDIEKLAELITPRTALITVTAAHGLTGVIQPVEEIAKLAKEKGVLLHLDASYIIGKTYFSFQSNSADYITFAGERIHSVKSGVLFSKKGRPIIPYIVGGEHQAGLLSALSVAAHLANVALDTLGLEGARLRDLFETEIQKQLPEANILFQKTPRLPNTSAILFPRIHAEALHYFLQRERLYPNTGGGYCQHLHKVLEFCQIGQNESVLSFSLSRMTTHSDMIRAATLICEKSKMLRKLTEDLF
ncbi:MAG TPA: aminotransferase class V-fold PLP-dependent enzyme [Chlamydiales bacterium]|nr:aminotransferase class V-fold PLP-dependent enzyme [Chlamydiales bacterium]